MDCLQKKLRVGARLTDDYDTALVRTQGSRILNLHFTNLLFNKLDNLKNQ